MLFFIIFIVAVVIGYFVWANKSSAFGKLQNLITKSPEAYIAFVTCVEIPGNNTTSPKKEWSLCLPNEKGSRKIGYLHVSTEDCYWLINFPNMRNAIISRSPVEMLWFKYIGNGDENAALDRLYRYVKKATERSQK